jgi:hypothetical protein
LEEPFFEEKGRITGKKQIGGDKTQVTYSANGTFKGNIEVTITGELIAHLSTVSINKRRYYLNPLLLLLLFCCLSC